MLIVSSPHAFDTSHERGGTRWKPVARVSCLGLCGSCVERGDCPPLAGAQLASVRWITSEIRGKSSRFPDFALRPLSLDPPFWHSDTRSSRSTGRRSAKPQGDVDGGARDLERGTESLTGRWGSAHRSHDECREHRRHTVARPTRVSARRAFGDPERLEGLPTGHSGSSAFPASPRTR